MTAGRKLKEKQTISRKEQAVLTKKKIFDTTIYLIRKKGYNKITIREICQAAELSVGTFYLYFLSKDDVLLELYRQVNEVLLKALPGGTAEERLISLVRAFYGQLEAQFDRELLTEICRASISIGRDMLLSPGQPFYRALEQAAADWEQETGCTDMERKKSQMLLQKLLLFLQGHLYQWLLSEDRRLSAAQERCVSDLQEYLRLLSG